VAASTSGRGPSASSTACPTVPLAPVTRIIAAERGDRQAGSSEADRLVAPGLRQAGRVTGEAFLVVPRGVRIGGQMDKGRTDHPASGDRNDAVGRARALAAERQRRRERQRPGETRPHC
jgi:hypothetical protein